MKLQDQVCSLELARKLETLGVRQESLFTWVCGRTLHEKEVEPFLSATPKLLIEAKGVRHGDGGINCVAAYTATELGEILIEKANEHNLPFHAHGKWWFVIPKIGDLNAKTEADARASMIVDLIENKLITV